jgi:hypothetical protein
MDKNIIYLFTVLNSLVKSELDICFVKEFLNKYMDYEYLNDSYFFENIDLSKVNYFEGNNDLNFNYKNYINFDILKTSPVIVFLNDNIVSIENLNSDVVFTRINFLDDALIKFISFFNDKYILDNLNIFSIINLLFFKNLNYFSILNYNFEAKPLYILNFFNDDYEQRFYFPRKFLKIQNSANLNVFDYVCNISKNLYINSNTYLLLEKKSKVNYFFLNDSKIDSLNMNSFYSKIYDDSFLTYNNHSFSGKKIKTNCYFFLFDIYSKVIVNFIRMLKFKSKNDITSKVFHYANNSFSRVFFKSVLSDFSSCNFNGLIDVDFNVLNSDGGLICKSLLLDNSSFITISPDLSIKNNEIKCFHGATVGFLEEETLFYLMSRGFSKDECISFLVTAFLNDIIYDDSLSCFNVFKFLFEKYYKY